jgi:hypothetical protein
VEPVDGAGDAEEENDDEGQLFLKFEPHNFCNVFGPTDEGDGILKAEPRGIMRTHRIGIRGGNLGRGGGMRLPVAGGGFCLRESLCLRCVYTFV